ncbi:MAG: hypothetical protein KG012_16935 [Deltaproteobacteria bacterium]|nr:hypothetical protein [Deltaproteobacteria bacterium]
MDQALIALFDEVLSQVQTGLPKKVLFQGEGTGGIASYAAGWMAGKGMDVIVLDGANCFNPYIASSFARKALISPERILKRIRIARAFTCYQMATLMGEQLPSLLKKEMATVPTKKPWVILLGPLTTFMDEDVLEMEVRPLFEKALSKVEKIAAEGVPFFLFQSPVFPGSKRAFLMKRLSQFSDLAWRISLEGQEPKMILEKRLTKHEIPCLPAGRRAPAFAEAASRRQANIQITNIQ